MYVVFALRPFTMMQVLSAWGEGGRGGRDTTVIIQIIVINDQRATDEHSMMFIVSEKTVKL